ncbi:MAG: bifunctional nuclease family protein [Prevotella sp.]|nr:bifunctional nuclease family protein [Prevotella sp.]
MKWVQLFYKDFSEIMGSNGFSVARLTDADEQRAISVICDKAMTEQMSIRFNRLPGRKMMLPEVLFQMMSDAGMGNLELMVYDIHDGQYIVSLLNKKTNSFLPIRMSDAVLLHYITRIPFYINEDLMIRQSSPYTPEARGIPIPINTLDTERLNLELERAIAEEDYRLASHLHEELQKRSKQ